MSGVLADTARNVSARTNWHMVTGFLLLLAAGTSAAAPPGSLAELLDYPALPRLKTWTAHQASGYDRLGGFYDSGNFLRVDPGPSYVLLDVQGKGVVDRMWFTYKSEFRAEPYDLLIYLDDQQDPRIHTNLDQLFLDQRDPFQPPLAGLCGNPRYPGRYCYVPLGFQSSCRVILRPTVEIDKYKYRQNQAGETIPHVYYQINYRLLPEDTEVRSFDWSLSDTEATALRDIQGQWSSRETVPLRLVEPEAHQHQVDLTVTAGERGTLAAFDSPGTITAVRLATEHPEALTLQFTWNGADHPAVNTPWGPFFGCPADASPSSPVQGLWFGQDQDTYYNFLPMPFHSSARLELLSSASSPVHVTGHIEYRAVPPDPRDALLHARRYDYHPPQPGEDYAVLETDGRGHFIALVMDRPGNMEGDDRFFVDRQFAPAVHGTGTEDFFNFAWGLSHVGSYPLHGITHHSTGSCCYRVHPSGIPYQTALQIHWEHGHDPRQGANHDQGRYSGTVFYYQDR